MTYKWFLLRWLGLSLPTLAVIVICPLPLDAATQVHELPTGQDISVQLSSGYKDFRLHAFHAKNTAGEILNIPAFLIDIRSGAGGWDSPDPTNVLPFTEVLSAVENNRVQLFYNGNRDDSSIGWLVVPRGWQLGAAAIGGDGSALVQFRAAQGRHSGWMVLTEQVGCAGCMPEVVAGLGIRAAAHAFPANTFFPLDAELLPKPIAIVHPDACTALVTYQAGNLITQGVIILYTGNGGLAEGTASLYIGLPGGDADLGKFIVNAFLKSHTKPPYAYRCESDTPH